jgi:Raf kinase inhibitor-like YbhB/YbcL family protein
MADASHFTPPIAVASSVTSARTKPVHRRLRDKNLIGVLLKKVRAGDRHLIMRDPRFRAAPFSIHLTSPDFGAWAMMPKRFTQDGENLSPPLTWENLPDGVVELVLVVQDPDVPLPDPLTHLIVFGIDPASPIAEGALNAGGALPMGRGAFGRIGYSGPRPIRSHGRHRYVFQLFALDASSGLTGTPDLKTVAAAMDGHVVARGELTGWYERN